MRRRLPVDRTTYDRSVAVLTEAVNRARIGHPDKVDALRRIAAASRDPQPARSGRDP